MIPGNDQEEGVAMESDGSSGEEMKILQTLEDCPHGC